MRSALWTKAELETWAAGLGAEIQGALPESIGGISIDSRSLMPGDAFFAIKGDRFDGHDYAGKAAEAGAALVIIDEAHKALTGNIKAPLLIAPDVMDALRALGRAARARLKLSARVAAVTGSVGKTTVKEMLAQALSPFGRVHKNPASFNNHWGVPLTLARMPRETDYAVFEIGMNHAGEIAPLAKLARPHLALITRIATVHMEHFKSVEEIAAAKAEIFSGLEKAGIAVLPHDDEFYDFLKRKAGGHKVISFGRNTEADCRLLSEKATPLGAEFIADLEGNKRQFVIAVQGAHMADNALAVLAAAWALLEKKADWDKIRNALADFTAQAGRGARYCLALPAGGSFTLIDESYNANPTSMRAALANLGQAPAARRIAVLGDMLELGTQAEREHQNLAEALQDAKADIVFLAGSLMLSLAEKLERDSKIECHWQENTDGLAMEAEKILRSGDCLMVKSSHSIQTERVVKQLLADYREMPQSH